MKSTNGSALLLIMALVALAAGGAWVLKPALFPGESRRASQSAKTTEKLIATTEHQGAIVAASLTKIAEANADAPVSPQRSFIADESTLALTLLPRADAHALIEAERRKVAVLEGHIAEARRLYEQATKTNAALQHERDTAISEKRAADDALQEAAAAHHAVTLQAVGAFIVAGVALLGIGYLKYFSVGPSALGRLMHDLKSDVPVEHAFDAAIPQRLYAHVAKARKVSAP